MFELPLNSRVEEKIAWARNCHQQSKNQWLANPKILDLLPKLENAIKASREKMSDIGIGAECQRCEQEDGGSCCGHGLEDKYSGTLLLLNLLLGQELPTKRLNSESCFFLGKNGCSLMARHTICINYLCKKITDKTDPEQIATMRELEGAELNYLFLLNEAIKAALRDQNT